MNHSGILAVDKPSGWTSRAVVDAVARLTRAKVGHAGTLDPLATGVLVVAVGAATRLISYLQQGRKDYVGQFRLGCRSDTDDSEGQVTAGGDWSHITPDRLEEACRPFVGRIEQVPPQFSAVHVAGQRSYSLARRGVSVDLAPRPVDVFAITLTRCDLPDFELHITCGSGTYIRSIGRDLGEALGCGALMTGLRRTRVGSFTLDQAAPVEALIPGRLPDLLLPIRTAVDHLPRKQIDADAISALRQGRSIPGPDDLPDGEIALLDSEGNLVALARGSAGRLQPHLVIPASA